VIPWFAGRKVPKQNHGSQVRPWEGSLDVNLTIVLSNHALSTSVTKVHVVTEFSSVISGFNLKNSQWLTDKVKNV
jgi:hypothetical protein